MSAHATVEELEALSRGELETDRSAAIDAHLAECENCRNELSWVRAERGLFSRRSRAPMPPVLWQNLEGRLDAPPQPLVNTRPRPRSQATQWYAVAAAACAILVTATLGGVSFARFGRGLVALWHGATPGGGGENASIIHHIEISTDDAPPFSGSFPVAGAVTLRVDTMAADVEAVAGARDAIRLELSDSKRKSAELRSEGPNVLRAFFDGVTRLESGRLRLLVPPGTRLEVSTASGEVSVSSVGGDVHLNTASGEVQLRDAQNIDINTASGDLRVGSFSGSARIHSASGDVQVMRGSVPLSRFDFSSASGELRLDGVCAKDCRLNIETVSGDVALHHGGPSSYSGRFHTLSGDLDSPDAPKRDDDDDMPNRERAFRHGDGQGALSVRTVSGDLRINAN